MNKNNIYLILFLLSIFACKQETSSSSENEIEAKIEKIIKENKLLKIQNDRLLKVNNAQLSHLVFFDIKEDISTAQLEFITEEFNKLGQIDGVQNFHLGEFEDIGDNRALTNREMIISMRFLNFDDFYSYQKDEKHFAIKKAVAPYLDQLPLSYDYMIKK